MMNNVDIVSWSKSKTNLLAKINFILRRAPGIRNEVPASMITNTSVLNDLKSLIDDPEYKDSLYMKEVFRYKLSIIESLPADTDVCVCQLAGCCDGKKICKYCLFICQTNFNVIPGMWNQQYDKVNHMVFVNNVLSVVDTVPGHTIRDILPQRLCINGDKCPYYKIGKCIYSHLAETNVAPSIANINLQKTNLCKQGDKCAFYKVGKCIYSHLPITDVVDNTNKKLQTPCKKGDKCPFYKVGKCNFSHTPLTSVIANTKKDLQKSTKCYKGDQCPFYQIGTCKYIH